MTRSALIIGAAGFIGRALMSRFVDDGVDCVGIDNFSVPQVVAPPLPILSLDARQLSSSDLSEFELVIHLAALKSVPDSFHGSDQISHNVGVDHHVIAEFAKSSARHLFLASSCEVYGRGNGRALTERDEVAPVSPYAVGKAASEQLVEVYRNLTEHSMTTLRLFNVYGPDEGRDAVVPAFVSAAARDDVIRIEGSGDQRRDLTFIDDAVQAISALVKACPGVGTVNIGSGESHSVLQIARMVVELFGRGDIEHVAPRPNEISDFRADISLLQSLTSVRRMVPLRAGIERCVEAYAC